ncbi:helix-turn-helix domain-containing protein [Tumebacillus lipolyticus]|uniref:Helix-turn-helix domain-containing protein n=1 Tax=Tumebacillus lipolyticus TaxID=1280370 RepID=A0ABW4ZWP7_9BACL
MNTHLSLGQKIKQIRMKKGVTQIELARGLCTPSMISQIESDRARPSYKILFAISERLDVPLEHLLKDVNLDLEHTSKFKMAISMVRAGEYQTAIPFLQELLDQPQARIPTVQVRLELANCLLKMGFATDAIPHLNDVQGWASARQDHSILVTSLIQIGLAYKQKNEYSVALFHVQRALDVLEKMEEIEPVLRAKALTALASIYEETGMATDAARSYEEALLLNRGGIEERGATFLRLAETYHRIKNYEKADEYATKAFTLIDELLHLEQQQEWKHRLVMLNRKRENWKGSITDLLSMAEGYEAEGKKEKAGIVYTDIALICSENDELDESWAFAEKARMLLPPTHPAMGRVHRVLAFVYWGRNDADRGQKHFENAAIILERHGKFTELEAVTLQMCHHLKQTGQHNEAFTRLEQFHTLMKKRMAQRGIVL